MKIPDLFRVWGYFRARARGLIFKGIAHLFFLDFHVGRRFEVAGAIHITHGWYGQIRIGDDFALDNVKITLSKGGKFLVGDRCGANANFLVACMSEIRIGDDCRIAENVSLRDFTHKIIPGLMISQSGVVSAPIVIGANVWIGRGVCILPGVSIGDNSVIGANAVVTKSIPANSVAAGIPARVIRDL